MKSNVTYFVDFKNRNVLDKKTFSFIEEAPKYDLTNFNKPPANTNFAFFSDKDRYDHSCHILSFFKDFSFEEILHFIEMGVLDKKEVSKKLNMKFSFDEEEASWKKRL